MTSRAFAPGWCAHFHTSRPRCQSAAGRGRPRRPEVHAACWVYERRARRLERETGSVQASPTGNLDRERRPATAGRRRVRVLDHELRTLKSFRVVDLGADEILVAHRVYQQGHPVLM